MVKITEPKDDSRILERDAWQDIIKSHEWQYFKKLLDEHKSYLERQVIVSVSNRDFDGAVRYGAKAEECNKILQLVEDRLAELKKPVEEED